MVDEVRVLRLLRSVTDDLAVLRRVTAIEACVDVAQHLCASEGWGPPRDNGDAVRTLGLHEVLSPDLAEQMRRAVGFRNVLLHDYIDVDDEIVLARLADLRDLEGFVAEVTKWLSTGHETR